MLTEDMPSAVANKHSADLKEINDAYKDFVEHYINSSGAKGRAYNERGIRI